MPVPSLVTDLSTTVASNSPAGSDNVFPDLDNYLRTLSAFLASIRDNSGNGWVSPYLTAASPSYTGTLTGGTGVVNLGSGQFYKDAGGNINFGSATRDATGSINASVQIQGLTGTTSSLGQYTWSASTASHPYQTFNKSMGTAVGTRGAVADGQALGITYWAGDDGANFIRAASISAYVDGTPGPSDMPGRLVFSTTAEGGSTPGERMRITQEGYVSIANSSPQVRFTVDRLGGGPQPASYTGGTTAAFIGSAAASSPSYVTLISGNTGSGGIFFGDTDADSRGRVLYDHSADSLAFWTSNTSRATLDSAGNFGLGVTPSAWTLTALQINNAALVSGGNTVSVAANAFYDGAWKYIATANASYYEQTTGQHRWFTAPSGTAGNAITFTQAMTLDASGDLQVSSGAVVKYAPAPASISTTATLTNANIQAQIINTTGTTYTVTMPLGTTLETLAAWTAVNLGYDFNVINTASGTITIAANTGVTTLGSLTIATGTSASFRIRRTAANTFILYRLN